MVENMLEGIEVRLGEDYLEKKAEYDGIAEKVNYTGAIDAYFYYCLGNLEYRSVRLCDTFRAGIVPFCIRRRIWSSKNP